ncbi:carbon-nitrogen hydrolase family protein [Caminibacter pacificus]|uniref:Carbon-nitrogen hydrolase family protein n=1 Tax=Caminibacter pacificus TaxID=1424653 RepID=A0AAJ4RDX4_9BACT|nr:carbon-nitrogen hydrolase family protein [Caminibacter pacificus]NPA87411.1 carbon-nitrogen hydrolase family protein [Campylobacterota bacterium]QCI28427.1 carbon-nitrogen hydrolase family protein [Caminibacter pacificus]ROR40848.1 nitrilase [Caminibacter pacificus]
MNIAIMQSDSLPLDKAKINYFLSQARKEKAKIFVLPEYVLNRFFKELEKMPLGFIKKQTSHQVKLLKKLSEVYDMTIIAPLIMVKGDNVYKVIGKFYKNSVRYYYSQVFMPYSHWNEDKFFSKKENKPMVFSVGNIRFGVMFGFESHFDDFWEYFRDKKVDCILIPSVGTFGSHKRWFEMLKSRAFMNNMYVVRVNRVGTFEDWEFYGNSFVIDPEGECVNMLGSSEEMAISDIKKEKVKEARKEWKFLKLYKNIEF